MIDDGDESDGSYDSEHELQVERQMLAESLLQSVRDDAEGSIAALLRGPWPGACYSDDMPPISNEQSDRNLAEYEERQRRCATGQPMTPARV